MRRGRGGIRPGWVALTGSGLILPGLLVGCGTTGGRSCWHIDNCATIPRGAIPPPAGTHLAAILEGQAARAEASDFVIHKHEWYLDGRQPGPLGRRHLATIGARLPGVPFPVVVEPVEPEELEGDAPASAAAELNEARRRSVVESLAALGIADADARVVLGQSRAEGLYGDGAARLGAQYLLQGPSGAVGNVGGFGTTTSGFGGGFGGLGSFGGGLGGFR